MFVWLTTFSMAHPWIFALVVLPQTAWVTVRLNHYGFVSWNRFLRSRNIKRHGWPPPHLDADGDFIREDV